MAAVPAVIYAIWALFFLQEHLLTVAQWLSVHLGGLLPFMTVKVPDSPSSYTSSAFIAGIAVGVVVLPTMTSVMREVFSQAPIGEREGAIALGATRWGMIRAVVLPFGRAGIIGGIMLGLGRALGETIVVYALISPMFEFTTHPFRAAPTRSPRTSPRATPSRAASPWPGCSAPGWCCSASPSSSTRSPASW